MTTARTHSVVRLMTLGALCAASMTARAQGNRPLNLNQYFGSSSEYYVPPDWTGNPTYEGRVTFVRIKYLGYEHWAAQGPGWAHDYPRAESHFDKIMREITTMRLFVEAPPIFGSTILALDDPKLFHYPIAYLSEPGGWHMTPAEVQGLRKYVSRGGFVIFDDMGCCTGPNVDLANLIVEWTKAFPKAKLQVIPPTDKVFDSFFKIDFTKVRGYYGVAEFYGFYEDNDPNKRLVAVINNNNDLGDFMEWSDQGFNVTPSNEAYKLAVNYFVYALTH